MCVLLSKVYIQANSCAKLDNVDNCDTGVIQTFLICLCEYINWGVLFLYGKIIPLISRS